MTAPGWVRVRMERGRTVDTLPRFRAVCSLCPWHGTLEAGIERAEAEADAHRESNAHLRAVDGQEA